MESHEWLATGIIIVVGLLIVASLAFAGLSSFSQYNYYNQQQIPGTTCFGSSCYYNTTENHVFSNNTPYTTAHTPLCQSCGITLICKSPACANGTITQNNSIPLSHYNITYSSGTIIQKPI